MSYAETFEEPYVTAAGLAAAFGVTEGKVEVWAIHGLPFVTLRKRGPRRYKLSPARRWWLDSPAAADQLKRFSDDQQSAIKAAVAEGATPADAIAALRAGKLKVTERGGDRPTRSSPGTGPLEHELAALLHAAQPDALHDAILRLARELDHARRDAEPRGVDFEPLLTQASIARVLGVTSAQIHRWRHDCGLPTVERDDGRVRFRLSEVEHWHERWSAAH